MTADAIEPPQRKSFLSVPTSSLPSSSLVSPAPPAASSQRRRGQPQTQTGGRAPDPALQSGGEYPPGDRAISATSSYPGWKNNKKKRLTGSLSSPVRAACLPGWNSGIVKLHLVEKRPEKQLVYLAPPARIKSPGRNKQADTLNRFPLPILSSIGLLLVNSVAPVHCA